MVDPNAGYKYRSVIYEGVNKSIFFTNLSNDDMESSADLEKVLGLSCLWNEREIVVRYEILCIAIWRLISDLCVHSLSGTSSRLILFLTQPALLSLIETEN